MADPIIIIEGSKISELPDGVTPTGDELMELVQAGVNVKLPLAVIRSNTGSLLVTNYLFDTNIIESDPTDGFIKFNNAAVALVTELYISSLTQAPIQDISGSIADLKTGDNIRVQIGSNPNNFVTYTLTGIATDNTGWWTVPVAFFQAAGLAFPDNIPLSVVFIFDAGGTPDHFKGVYVSLAALQAAVPTGNPGDYAFVDAGVGNNPNIYIWDDSDSDWVLGGSAPTPDASETIKGVVEEADQSEANAGTAIGGTGAKLFLTPAKLLALVATFANQITFTISPIVSALTANKFLRSGISKELVSVDPATQAEMVTGTDDTKPATPLGVEKKRSIKLVSFSNSATGSSTIDCDNKEEIHVVYTTTVTGGITIALSNNSNLQVLNVTIPITGLNIGITTPSTTRMARYNEVSSGDGWYQSTKILQVSSVGTADTHELSFKRASSGLTFNLVYDGPFRA